MSNEMGWHSVKGICDDCHTVGVKCYHLFRAGLYKLNGELFLPDGKNKFGFRWESQEEIIKILNDVGRLHGRSSAGHFCNKCAEIRRHRDEEYWNEEVGQHINKKIHLCLTKIYDDVLMIHVE